jgi:2-C-methyl-D-erythritol 2,4-cyclodiphosphate synthase
VLGGVSIESDFHLQGHSDADAIAHAITDAILGAAAAGDIGAMFPDTDQSNKGRDSMEMLALAVARLGERGTRVVNVDVTVIAERPKIGSYRDAIRERLARVLRVSTSDVSVKGKTNEGMGWIGHGEGLACIAVATVIADTAAAE